VSLGPKRVRKEFGLDVFADAGSRVKQLQEEPHSQKESEAAVGLTTDNGKLGTEKMEVEPTS